MRLGRVGIIALMFLLVGSAVVAAPRTKPTIHFFSGSQSDAHWTPKDSSDANRMSIELQVGPEVGASYAGLEFLHEEGQPPPAVEPYFWHKEDRAGPSGGSPRLVIFFPTGNIQLRPDQWSTGWQRVGQDGDGNWDVSGGDCGFRYDVTYEEALACHPDAVVTNVILVTDSNWLYGEYINWVDQIQYNGFVYSHASDNSNRP
jgi:hypothetical protein